MMKVSDINRIVNELWQITYRGEDIDEIAIVSGEESGSVKAARSYNYRVAMRKGGVQLDMKVGGWSRCDHSMGAGLSVQLDMKEGAESVRP